MIRPYVTPYYSGKTHNPYRRFIPPRIRQPDCEMMIPAPIYPPLYILFKIKCNVLIFRNLCDFQGILFWIRLPALESVVCYFVLIDRAGGEEACTCLSSCA